jgi:hypothetical protein
MEDGRNQGGNFQEGPNRARDALNRGCLTHSLLSTSRVGRREESFDDGVHSTAPPMTPVLPTTGTTTSCGQAIMQASARPTQCTRHGVSLKPSAPPQLRKRLRMTRRDQHEHH